MAAKELKRMSRGDLLQLLIQKSQEVETLTEQLAQQDAQLKQISSSVEKQVQSYEKAGSLAEAAIASSNLIADAQKAADLYLAGIERMRLEQEAACEALLKEARTALADLRAKQARAVELSGKEQARFYYEAVCPAMQSLRGPIDRLEMMVSGDLWPIPTYDELLFNV